MKQYTTQLLSLDLEASPNIEVITLSDDEIYDDESPSSSPREETKLEFKTIKIENSTRKPAKELKKKTMRSPRNTRNENVLREIIVEKLSTKHAISTKEFRLLIKEVFDESFPGFRIQYGAIEALQLESELMLTKFFSLANLLSKHRARETLSVKDLRMVKTLLELNATGTRYIV